MPGPLDFLRSLDPASKYRVPALSQEEQDAQDEEARKAQEGDSSWRSYARKGFEGLMEFGKGLAGIDTVPKTPEGGAASFGANNAGQLVNAGLPFVGIPGMFSRVDRAVSSLPETSTAASAFSKVRNAASKEEIEYRGLKDLLGGGAQKVKKADIVSHLEDNPLQVGVKQLGGGPRPASGHVPDGAGGLVHPDWQAPKYENYTLPGGDNYREDLITLKRPEPDLPGDVDKFLTKTPGEAALELHGRPWTELEPHEQSQVLEHINYYDAMDRATAAMERHESHPPDFTSSHFDEPNILAHVRHKERELPPARNLDADLDHDALAEMPWRDRARHIQGLGSQPEYQGSKGRLLEEIQSDWHQQGRNTGYRDPQTLHDLDSRQRALNDSMRDLNPNVMQALEVMLQDGRIPAGDSVHDVLNTFANSESLNSKHWSQAWPEQASRLTPEQFDDINHYLDLRNQERAAFQQLRTLEHLPPDAPFKEAWPDLALKQQVLDVANRDDLNWLGFTTGQTQADRYNMANHVNQLNYDWHPDLQSWDMTADNANPTGIIHDKDLEQWIGPDAAQALRAHRDQMIQEHVPLDESSGDFVSGTLDTDTILNTAAAQGQHEFYDRQLPTKLEKILKPFGGKVEQGELPGKEASLSWSPPRNVPGREYENRAFYSRIHRGQEHVADTWPPVPIGSDTFGQVTSQGEELADLIKAQPHMKEKGIPIWLAHLPPEMKEKIRQAGLPLLSLLGLGYMQPDQSMEAR